MGRSQSPAEKARAIARTAQWIATGVEGAEQVDEPFASAIDAAYSALRVISEATARNQVCGFVAHAASKQGQERYDFVRSMIATIQDGDEYDVECAPIAASEAAIDNAVDAWGRQPGQRASGLPSKWEAMAELLKESGFSYVAPDSLRRAWDRRLK